ncbi:MAG: hypothetical protein DRP61_05385 [Candidatus Omnitrophota bacterium]|nr:MAG: hypothetical protein DRP61_05385 [Candidatus Omnitrophota bacterium]
MSRIVLDTNVIVALLDSKDVHHSRAIDLVRRIESENKLLIMDCILVELYSVIARRAYERGYNFSQVLLRIREMEGFFELINAYDYRPKLHNEILKLMVKTEGRMNYHDALISLVMRRRRIRRLATFDRDFGYVEWLQIVS